MNTAPRELARKRPAEIVAVRRTDARGQDGKVIAHRRGMTGTSMFHLTMLLLIGSLFAGYLLSAL